MSLHWYIPVILHQPKWIVLWIMPGMFQSREILSQGTINLGTRGPRTFVRGHIVLGRPFTPPQILNFCTSDTTEENRSWMRMVGSCFLPNGKLSRSRFWASFVPTGTICAEKPKWRSTTTTSKVAFKLFKKPSVMDCDSNWHYIHHSNI